MKLLDRFRCGICGGLFSCQCGYTLAIIGIAVAVASAGYGAYQASEAAQQQASMAKKAAQQQADAEAQAAQARAAQIQYNADKLKRSFLSREAGAGVQVGQGSLLETEGQFAFDTEYSKQLAKYPHELAGASDKYQSDLFGFQQSQAKANEVSGALIAGAAAGAKAYAGSSLATATPSYTRGSTGDISLGDVNR